MLDTGWGQPAPGTPSRDDPVAPERSPAEGTGDTLVLSPAFGVECCDAVAATIFSSATGTRRRIPRALYDRLLAFREPRTIAAIAEGEPRLIRALALLRDAGILLDPHHAAATPPVRPVTDPPVRLFDCPAHKTPSARADVVAIGIPYDGGDRDAAGARYGPADLRRTSLQFLYELDAHTGRPRGWFDADLGRPMLPGVVIGDGGDVLVVGGEPQERTFARATGVLERLIDESGSVCAVLGGDATVGFPLIDALQTRGQIGVIRIGGLTESVRPPPARFVSASTLPCRVLMLPGVDAFVQVGASDPGVDTPAGFTALTAADIVNRGVAACEPYLRPGQAIHLGLDMSMLASSPDPRWGRSVDERFSYRKLRALIAEIGERYRIVGIDLTGINPLSGMWGVTGMAAAHLLLAMLSAAVDHDRADLA